MLAITLAPTGYPLVIPTAKGKEAHPGALNKGRITGSSKTPTALIKFVLLKISVATRKGKMDGKTILNQRSMPTIAELTAVLENITNSTINKTHNIDNICNFHEELILLYLYLTVFFGITKTPLTISL